MSITLEIEDDHHSYTVLEWQYYITKGVDTKKRSSKQPVLHNVILKLDNGRLETVIEWVTTTSIFKKRLFIIEDPAQNTGKLVTTELVDVRCCTYEIDIEGVYVEIGLPTFVDITRIALNLK